MPGKKLYIQDTSGSAYECEIDPATTIGTIAAEFFEAKDWPQQDSYGGGQRAVVEFADPKTGKNIRLGVDQSIEQANLPDGAMLYIYPEAVAGAIDTRRRLAAVKADQEDMSGLPDAYPHISYETNRDDTPDEYNITFNCRSFAAPPIHEGERPELSDLHKVKILLTGEYPREAPLLEWLTKLFHPNVNTDGLVCLGQLY
jgi:hypothetical protein